MECPKMDGFVGFLPFLHFFAIQKDYDLLTNSGNVISSNLDEKGGGSFFFLLEAQDLAKAALAQRDAREGGLIFLADGSSKLEMLKQWQQKKSKKIESSEGDDLGHISSQFVFFFRRRFGR